MNDIRSIPRAASCAAILLDYIEHEAAKIVQRYHADPNAPVDRCGPVLNLHNGHMLIGWYLTRSDVPELLSPSELQKLGGLTTALKTQSSRVLMKTHQRLTELHNLHTKLVKLKKQLEAEVD